MAMRGINLRRTMEGYEHSLSRGARGKTIRIRVLEELPRSPGDGARAGLWGCDAVGLSEQVRKCGKYARSVESLCRNLGKRRVQRCSTETLDSALLGSLRLKLFGFAQ
jgi:hypothetical protein